MKKFTMERKAEDNKYLHRDFHVLADRGLMYIGQTYGDQAVVEYLTEYTLSYYKLLIRDIKNNGIVEFKNYLENIYKAEECEDALDLTLVDENLKVKIKYCPAVKFMLSVNYTPSKWYVETVNTVYDVIAKESGYLFNLSFYDQKNGACEFSFEKV